MMNCPEDGFFIYFTRGSVDFALDIWIFRLERRTRILTRDLIALKMEAVLTQPTKTRFSFNIFGGVGWYVLLVLFTFMPLTRMSRPNGKFWRLYANEMTVKENNGQKGINEINENLAK
jgi:hypothetical protein